MPQTNTGREPQIILQVARMILSARHQTATVKGFLEFRLAWRSGVTTAYQSSVASLAFGDSAGRERFFIGATKFSSR